MQYAMLQVYVFVGMRTTKASTKQPVYKVRSFKQFKNVVFECFPLYLSLYSCFYLCLIFFV